MTVMKKLRWAFLGLSLLLAAVIVLWLAFDIYFLIPFLNTIAMLGAPLCLLLFFLLSIRKQQHSIQKAFLILLSVLCAAVLIFLFTGGSFYLVLGSAGNFGTVHTSPQGQRKMVVVTAGFLDTWYEVNPVRFGCVYMDSRGRSSEGVIKEVKWPDDHTAEVFLCNTVTTDAWWRYDFITKEWKWAEP